MRSTLRSFGSTFAVLALLAACGSPPRAVDGGGIPAVDAFRVDSSIIDGGGTMCTTMGDENTPTACSDGCDNDGNSFFDCSDFDCCTVRTDCPATTTCGMRPDGGTSMTFTIAQLQDRSAAGHPAPDTRVTVNQAGMVALTGRVLVSSATGGTSMSCRFAVWVGAAVSGDFTAIQVQENLPLTDGITNCFDLPEGRITDAFAPGDVVTSIENATYDEFCTGAAGTDPCTMLEASNIFLGGSATITRGAPGTPPVGTVVTVADLVATGGAPGTRAIALEGGLLAVEDVRIGTRMDGTFTQYFAYDAAAPTVQLDITVANFPETTCVRAALTALAAGTDTVGSITGVLLPNFGRWSLRIRDELDIVGVTCP